MLKFTGERIVPGADNCEPTFAQKMYQVHVARYAFAAQFAAGAAVLDVGCGVGYGSRYLAMAGAASVIGFDLDRDAIDHAQKFYFGPEITFRCHAAVDLDITGNIDLVTCFELIEHIEEQDKVLDKIKRALRPNGILVISTPRPHEEIQTYCHVKELSFDELFEKLKERFKLVVPYFQRNLFTTFVGTSKLEKIDNIVHVIDGHDLSRADYYIFVCSDDDQRSIDNVQSVLSVNDDSYILNLENDVEILRRVENDHLATISHIRAESGPRAEALNVAERRIDGLDQINQKLIEMRGELSGAGAIAGDLAALGQRISQLSDQLAIVADHESELKQVRVVLTERSARLADTESRMYQVGQELSELRNAYQTSERALGEALSQLHEVSLEAASVRGQFDDLQRRFDETTATLTRFRKSFSWAVTRPLRWFARQFKQAGR